MTKIDIFSGFLGAGKTTLIKKLLGEAYVGEKVVLIENEFGQIGIDGGFLREAGIEITEMNSGCICCSLVGDFKTALSEVLEKFSPSRILIEPSGVGKLSDVVKAVSGVLSDEVVLGSCTVVADASKCKIYMKNFGEFYNDQIENAGTIVLSRTGGMKEEKREAAVALLREHNETAVIITTPWEELDGKTILSAMEDKSTLADLMEELEHEHHHHEHECDDPHCDCHHEHHHHEHECDDPHCDCHHEHHHHEHECDDPHCDCHHEHEHHHKHDHECHDPNCSCHSHHHADEVFSTFGRETTKTYTKESLCAALAALDAGEGGTVLRAKGIVAGENGVWYHFDYVPGEHEIRVGSADIIGRLCVIGSGLHEDKIASAFGL